MEKIFTDLYLLRYSKKVIILSNYSNFVRIVLFLRNKNDPQVTFLKGNKIVSISDLSTIFAKHYDF